MFLPHSDLVLLHIGISLTLEQFAKMRECWDAYCEAVEQVTKPGGGAKIPPTPNSPINGPSWLVRIVIPLTFPIEYHLTPMVAVGQE